MYQKSIYSNSTESYAYQWWR